MRNSRVAIFASLLIVGWIGEGFAQTEQSHRFQFDDTIYQLPEGYRKGKTSLDHVDIYGSKKGFHSIAIFRSEPVPDDIDSWIEQKIRSVANAGSKLSRLTKAKSLRMGSKKAIVTARLTGRRLLIAFAALGKQKANVVVMRTRIARGDDAKTILDDRLQNEFLPFVMNLRFVSDGATPVLGQPSRGKLDGTFTGLKYSYNLDLSTNFDQAFYTFSKSGRFLTGLPKGKSVREINFSTAMQMYPHRSGNYRVKGGKIHLDFADGTAKQYDFEPSKNGFRMGKQFSKVTVPADGTSYSGTFRDVSYAGFSPGSGIDGGVAQSRSIQFLENGRYIASEFRSVFGNFENDSGDVTGGFGSSGKPSRTSGTYTIKDGTIILDSGSKSKTCSIVQIGDRLLFINGIRFLKGRRE